MDENSELPQKADLEGKRLRFFSLSVDDPDESIIKGMEFANQASRSIFACRVFTILVVQFLSILAFIFLFLYHEPTKKIAYNNAKLEILVMIVIIIFISIIAYYEEARRVRFVNIFFFIAFTFIISLLIGFYNGLAKFEYFTPIVLVIAVISFLALFSVSANYDLSRLRWLPIIVLVIYSIGCTVEGYLNYERIKKQIIIIYVIVGLFLAYIVYIVQLIISGRHRYSIASNEYIFSVLNIWMCKICRK